MANMVDTTKVASTTDTIKVASDITDITDIMVVVVVNMVDMVVTNKAVINKAVTHKAATVVTIRDNNIARQNIDKTVQESGKPHEKGISEN